MEGVEKIITESRAKDPSIFSDISDDELTAIIAPRLLPSILEGTELHLWEVPDSDWHLGFVFEPPCWTQKTEMTHKAPLLHCEGFRENENFRLRWLFSMRKAICSFLGFGR